MNDSNGVPYISPTYIVFGLLYFEFQIMNLRNFRIYRNFPLNFHNFCVLCSPIFRAFILIHPHIFLHPHFTFQTHPCPRGSLFKIKYPSLSLHLKMYPNLSSHDYFPSLFLNCQHDRIVFGSKSIGTMINSI